MTSDEPRPDTIELMCPWCQGPFGTTLSMAGSTVHCPHCDGEITVPSRDHLLAMMTSPAEPPPVATGGDDSPAPPVVAKSVEPPPVIPQITGIPEAAVTPGAPHSVPRVAAEAPPPATPSPRATAVAPEIPPPKVVHAQSREGDAVAFQARGKVIRTERGDVELRERSRGERSFRRTVRNIVLIVLCLAILLGLPAWLLSRKPKPPPTPLPSTDLSTPDAP